MDDQRPVTDLGEPESGSHYRRPGYSVSVYGQGGQVSLVPRRIRAEMEPCSAWIEVLARLTPRDPLPTLQGASQEAEFVDMEAVEPRREPVNLRREQQTETVVLDRDIADLLPDSQWPRVEAVNGDSD